MELYDSTKSVKLFLRYSLGHVRSSSMVSNPTGARPHSGAIAKAVVRFANADWRGGKKSAVSTFG